MKTLQTNQDVNQHIESLRTRLGFAKFKLNNGWEDKTLVDVENYWKKKQRESIKDLPTPRFTQQHIIDKHASHPKRIRRPSKTLPSPMGSPEKRARREPVKNSLEYLSYAIAMTEKEKPWTRHEPSLSIPDLLVKDETPSPTSSAAAHTMMMFFNNNRA
ncbi:hypothetical protein BY458DRAFT_586620 [Sporodiniella umbellata]|nr:hypothetical protein BY458DRAFT_586620 [Sporodiniella umbellata]